MFIFDPIASLIVVAGVFIYFACKGASEKKPVKTRTKEEEWADEVKDGKCLSSRPRKVEKTSASAMAISLGYIITDRKRTRNNIVFLL
jgi:hypothetical protein